jgi:hypothetical protein
LEISFFFYVLGVGGGGIDVGLKLSMSIVQFDFL